MSRFREREAKGEDVEEVLDLTPVMTPVMGVIEHKEGIRRCSKVQCHCSLSWKAISSCWLTGQHWGQGSCWIYPHTLGLQAAQVGDLQDLELQTVYLCCQLRIFVWVWMIKWDNTCEVFSLRSNTQKVLNMCCLLLLLWLLLLTPFIEPLVALLLLLNINNISVHSFSHRPFYARHSTRLVDTQLKGMAPCSPRVHHWRGGGQITDRHPVTEQLQWGWECVLGEHRGKLLSGLLGESGKVSEEVASQMRAKEK